MTELRSKRDKGDTASLLTVDEITAEVESRRDSRLNTPLDDSVEEWTKVDDVEDAPEDATELESSEEEYSEEEEEDEDVDEESTEDEDTLADEEEEGEGERIISKGTTTSCFSYLQFTHCV